MEDEAAAVAARARRSVHIDRGVAEFPGGAHGPAEDPPVEDEPGRDAAGEPHVHEVADPAARAAVGLGDGLEPGVVLDRDGEPQAALELVGGVHVGPRLVGQRRGDDPGGLLDGPGQADPGADDPVPVEPVLADEAVEEVGGHVDALGPAQVRVHGAARARDLVVRQVGEVHPDVVEGEVEAERDGGARVDRERLLGAAVPVGVAVLLDHEAASHQFGNDGRHGGAGEVGAAGELGAVRGSLAQQEGQQPFLVRPAQ